MYKDEFVINKQDILQLLNEIGRKLTERNQTGSLVICGGAAMALLFNARDLTHDIDSQFKPEENIQDFKSIIDEITLEKNLPDNHWCNDDFSMFSDDYCKNLKSQYFHSFQNLDVFMMTPESLLAMKLVSARPRSLDRPDAIVIMKALGVRSMDEINKIVDEHLITDKMHPDEARRVKSFIVDTFEDYQSQIEDTNNAG